jgi:FkbM family methyltransferase
VLLLGLWHASTAAAECIKEAGAAESSCDASDFIQGTGLLQKAFVNGKSVEEPAGSKSAIKKVKITEPEKGLPCSTEVAVVEHELGGKFCVPTGISRPAADAVKAGNVWELDTHTFFDAEIKAFSEPGDVATMGLFFGDFLPHLSRAVGADQRVWGFEPSPANFDLARGTVSANQLKNVWIANAGVGTAEAGSLEFCVMKDGMSNGGTTHVGEEKGCTMQAIPIIALDNIFPRERRINLIHADVEGQEFNLLKGAEETLKKWKPLVMLEDRNGDGSQARKEIEEFMEGLGYKLDRRIDENIVFRYQV